MTATAHPRPVALADLALALSQASGEEETVRRTTARATAELIGGAAGISLLRDDGRYDSLTLYHPDPQHVSALADALDRHGTTPEDGYSTDLRATRRPVVLTPPAGSRLTDEQLADLLRPRPGGPAGADAGTAVPDIGAAVLCPVVVDDRYAGYLLLVRSAGDGAYTSAEIDLARAVTGELAMALSSTRSLELLRASEQRYRRVLESIPEGVLQVDPDGMVSYANEPAGVLLGLPCAQVTELPLHSFLDERGRTEMARRLAESIAGRATVGAVRLVRADGSHRSVRISMVPLPDEHGRPDGSLCMLTDTTDQLDARTLKRQLDHLRRLDSLGQLIGGISHDFNNLLTVVAGSADLLAATLAPDSPEHQLATEIMQATATGRTLTHQLLAFGRTDGNRPETIPVADLFTEMQSLFHRTLGEHIGLELAFGPEVWPVRVERGPLEQALVNLAANARDAMPRGGVLRVTADNAELGPGDLDGGRLTGRVVHLAVSDTGAGMDEETRRRAFEPFFTTRPTSAGLGLATTAGIVRSIGGEISLESQPRLGTTVHLYLPAAPAGPDAAHSAATAPTEVREVLVVEDQADLAQVVKRLIEPAGYQVTVCIAPRDALALVTGGGRPDLLVTDVVMPGMTGPELAAALRKYRPDLPVVYMSGYTAAALGPQIHLDERSVLVEKPFNRSTLLGAIRDLCGPPADPPS